MAWRRSSTSLAAVAATRTMTAQRSLSTTTTILKDSYDHILVEKMNDDKVGVITLHRPKALNALCDALFDDLLHASQALNQDEGIGCMVLTGSTKGKRGEKNRICFTRSLVDSLYTSLIGKHSAC